MSIHVLFHEAIAANVTGFDLFLRDGEYKALFEITKLRVWERPAVQPEVAETLREQADQVLRRVTLPDGRDVRYQVGDLGGGSVRVIFYPNSAID